MSWVKLVVLVAISGVVLSSPVSFPEGNAGQKPPQVYHRNDNNNRPSGVGIPDSGPETTSNITPPPAPAEEEEEEDSDQKEPTIEDLVNRAPLIWNNIQNYINSAINSYSANETAPNEPPAQLNQFLGLVNGFINVTNSFAQQFLEAPPTGSTPTTTPVENEIVYSDVAKSNINGEKKVKP